ncbi:hypothetical protein EXE42_16645, partial [Halorubrum sp. SP3]|uniref:hypothetical protein n=1 Tax=Halorubrum sp. SP3 TaxID=1537265 RepID=UPI0010F52F4A
MLRPRYHRFAAFGLGVGTGGALLWLGIDVLLSSAVAVALAVSVAFQFRTNREFPDRWTGSGWRNDRWTLLSLAVTNFAALVGVRWLPLPNGYGAAVSFLIIFVGVSAYLGGLLAAKERGPFDDERSLR